ncbi:MAG: 4-alpha-glucanotransferase, partial [Muribaculaceae bacterium]|nr:4-alpha-glucanotransferase [Muribaculaceae bacterium]
TVAIDVPDDVKSFDYNYIVRNENGNVKHEWGHPHLLLLPSNADTVEVFDRWHDQPWDKPYYSSAFTECICKRDSRAHALKPAKGKLQIQVTAPMVKSDEVLAICGSADELGAWDAEKAVVMNDAAYPVWTVNLPTKGLNASTEYKFVILKAETKELVAWESGSNRYIGINPETDSATVIAGLRFINPLAPWKGAGTAIPVFSIRTDKDFGVGDFGDLFDMVDWCVETGQTFLQILPINDTTMTHTWTDSYPYNANSTFALHPMYLRLTELGSLNDADRQAYYDALGLELNSLAEIDYERVTQGKLEYAREIFAQNGKQVIASKDFKEFVKRNDYWLKPYAAFCVLRDKFGTPDYNKWGEYAEYNEAKIERFVCDNTYNINFVYYLQYNLDKQMHAAKDYANSKGVAIKGDIPIGISRTSVDAWLNPRLFNLDCQAGAPPDDFSILGQNWGFPTYNWEEMSRDGFAWWKFRFKKMSEYFDAYRIDHVLGFFRIWQIPMDALHGLLGLFNPALPFSPDELRHSYDFLINTETQTKPFIMDWFLGDFFGEYSDEARERFLDSVDNGRYLLKPEFATQRKVADYFAAQEKSEKNDHLCNALMSLIDNVLFIEDPYEKGKYHPRISAQHTFAYRSLNDYERWCYDRLYNDFFYHRHNDFWYGKAMWKLPPLIDATDMLVCAEDLGMIPACVPAVMEKLEILSLEIQRMPKDPNSAFGNTWQYPYFSVCTTSTHDMGGIRQWWEEDRAKTQQFYNSVLHDSGEAPYFAEPWICDQIIDIHLKSPSMLCIIPLQDWLSINGAIRRNNPREEQINVPANSRHYWRYRMHLTVEELRSNREFTQYLKSKIKSSGR